MPTPATANMIVRNVPPEIADAIRGRLTAGEAANMNDLVVGILATACRVKFEPSGRSGGTAGEYETLILRVPVKLRQAIRGRAAQITNGTGQGVVLAILADHLGVLPGRVSRRSRAA